MAGVESVVEALVGFDGRGGADKAVDFVHRGVLRELMCNVAAEGAGGAGEDL